MKVFDKKDVFSWANCEEAKQYIGKYCYFADKLGDLENQVKKDRSYKLQKASQLEIVHSVFLADDEFWGLCLPAEKVIEVEEKKYRPFKNLSEFKECISKDTLTCLDHGIEIIDMSNNSQYRIMILGTFTNGIILPLYGELTMKQLFEKFKININGDWQPFGVEE